MSSTYTIYKADYNPIPNYLDIDPLRDTFDQGNPYFDRYEQKTANDKFERVVHRSLEHLYYRDFYTNNKASFGSGHIKKQERRLGDKAYVISMPQSKFGESILPGSVKMTLDYSFLKYVNISHGYMQQGTWTVVDDMFGNLYVSGSGTNPEGYYYETPLGPVGGPETDYSSSIAKNKVLVGEWPFDSIYKFVDTTLTKYTSSYDRGFWPLQSQYNNITIKNADDLVAAGAGWSGIYKTNLQLDSYIGFGMYFDGVNGSVVELKPTISQEYQQKYNFENGDYTIYLNLYVLQGQTNCVLLAKEGPEDDIRVDKDGNIHRNNASTKVPWKIIVQEGVIKFQCQSGTNSVFTSSNTNQLATGYNSIIITKSGSQLTIQVDNNLAQESVWTETIPFADKAISNKANIFIGNNYKGDAPLVNAVIGTVKIYKGALNQYERKILSRTCGAGSLKVGNVFYNHGMMTLTALPMQWTDITSVECRGTHTIWENEVSCTVAPGEFGMSSNPTLQEYNSETDQYEYTSFATSSDFKPYITTIGLYDNLGRLLVVGKLNTPIQTPDNTDTTFIVRYDR